MPLSDKETPAPELPTGFIVSQTQPHRYSIVFNDQEIETEIRQSLNKLKPLNSNEADLLRFAKGTVGYKDLYEEYRSSFSHSAEFLDAYDRLNQNCYWGAVQYVIEILIDTDKGDSSFSKSLTIPLTEEQVRPIRINTTVMLENSFRVRANEQSWIYNFAYAVFDEKVSG